MEHFYQANKTLDTDRMELIRNSILPSEACKLGNDPQTVLRSDWDDVVEWPSDAMKDSLQKMGVQELRLKDKFMLDGLILKFRDNPSLAHMLIETRPRSLIYTGDSQYWGKSTDGDGKNMLGILTEYVRDNILSTREVQYYDAMFANLYAILGQQGYTNISRLNGQDVDCLLYTSPSPRDGLLSRMPSSA